MPPPLAPSDTPKANRLKIALYSLSRARRHLLDAAPYMSELPEGRNFAGLISALEERIDRVRLAYPAGPDEDCVPIGVYDSATSLEPATVELT